MFHKRTSCGKSTAALSWSRSLIGHSKWDEGVFTFVRLIKRALVHITSMTLYITRQSFSD